MMQNFLYHSQLVNKTPNPEGQGLYIDVCMFVLIISIYLWPPVSQSTCMNQCRPINYDIIHQDPEYR